MSLSKKHLSLAALAFTTLLGGTLSGAQARDQIRAVGSSTVYPFTAAAAEQFGQGGTFKTPIVESTGTGGGFKLFCAGTGSDHPDINDASREMTDSEKELCKKNGVEGVTELTIGYDGIVLASSKKGPAFNLTKQQIFMALGRQVPKDGKLVANPYTKWNEIDPALPAETITVYGPPPTSGTRDAFVEMAFEEACKNLPEFKAAYPDDKERGKSCKLVREDGKFVEAGEDDNLIIRKLDNDQTAMGIFGYSYLEQNKSHIQAAKLDGVEPTFQNISSGTYKLARKLYIYVKNDHIGKIPGLAEFAQSVVSNAAIGPDGYMSAKGLIMLHDDDRKKSQAIANALSAAK